MNDDNATVPGDGARAGGGFARRLGGRLQKVLSGPGQAPPERPQRSTSKSAGEGAGGEGAKKGPSKRRPDPQAELEQARAAGQRAQRRLDEVTEQRDQLRAQRLEVQQVLGAQHGQRVLPRLRVEKTNGVPSFVVGQRMMQRVFRLGDDPAGGLDGLGGVFADRAAAARFVRSHGIPVEDGAAPAADPTTAILVHAFHGEIGLVELRGPGGARHVDGEGQDAGDIRPALAYDPELALPEGFEQICAGSAVLSAHVPRPYVQVSWAPDPQSPRVLRIDVDPDRIPVLTPDWDEHLGSVFDGAYARFLVQPYRTGALANRVPGGTFDPEVTP